MVLLRLLGQSPEIFFFWPSHDLFQDPWVVGAPHSSLLHDQCYPLTARSVSCFLGKSSATHGIMVPRGAVLLCQQLLKWLELLRMLLVSLWLLGYNGLQMLSGPSPKILKVDLRFFQVFSARGSR